VFNKNKKKEKPIDQGCYAQTKKNWNTATAADRTKLMKTNKRWKVYFNVFF